MKRVSLRASESGTCVMIGTRLNCEDADTVKINSLSFQRRRSSTSCQRLARTTLMATTLRRSGFALMAALWLVVLVGVTGYELSVHSRTRRLAVANSFEEA